MEHTPELLEQMRKLHLHKIGRAFLTYIGEAQHGGWDGWDEAAELEVIDRFLGDFLAWLLAGEEAEANDWGFGGPEAWNGIGIRRIRTEIDPPNIDPEMLVRAAVDAYRLRTDMRDRCLADMMRVLESYG